MKIQCPTCLGKGEAYFSCCTGEVVEEEYPLCHKCKEHLGEETCPDCNGTGEIEEGKTELTHHAPSMILAAEYLTER